MDVKVDSKLIRLEREKRAWTQEHLAKAAGLSLRTIQRRARTALKLRSKGRQLARRNVRLMRFAPANGWCAAFNAATPW